MIVSAVGLVPHLIEQRMIVDTGNVGGVQRRVLVFRFDVRASRTSSFVVLLFGPPHELETRWQLRDKLGRVLRRVRPVGFVRRRTRSELYLWPAVVAVQIRAGAGLSRHAPANFD